MTEYVACNNQYVIPLGRQGDNLTTEIKFPVVSWEEEFGAGAFEVIVQRPADSAMYPVITRRDGEFIVWTVRNTDVANTGKGKCQISLVIDGAAKKSAIFMTSILPSIEGGGTVPEPYEDWVESVIEAGAAATTAAQEAAQSAEDAAESAEAAETSATNAATSEENASGYAETAETAKDAAIEAKEATETAQTAAETAQSAAEAAEENASGYATAAAGNATNAQNSATAAANAKTAAEAAEDAAVTAKNDAVTAKDDAVTAKTAAEAAQAKAEEAVGKNPYIDETTNHWMVWDADEGDFVDTGVMAKGEVTQEEFDDLEDTVTSHSSQIANLEALGLTVVNGEINITFDAEGETA